MAHPTSSQNPPRNSFIRTTFGAWSAVEKFVLSILERFRLPEIGKVVQVFASDMEVLVELPYRPVQGINVSQGSGNLVTKKLKVYSIFASNDEGICAPPNVGDWGVCFFRAGDDNSGFFFGFHWGKINKVPKYHNNEIQPKDLLIKRNGSHFLINERGDIELWHVKKNQGYISNGFEVFDTKENQRVEIQRYCNQHTKPYEFKLMTWVRERDGKQEDYQVDGQTNHVQLHRRRITLWNSAVMGACPYDPNLVTDSSGKISPSVFETYISDGSYDVYDEVVDKTITQKDGQLRWYTGKINKHTIKYAVGVGGTLLRPIKMPREDYEDTFEFNWDKGNQALSFKETNINDNFCRVKEYSCFKGYVSWTEHYSEMFKAEIQTYQGIDTNSKAYNDCIAKIRYEIDECDQMSITDDVVDEQAERALAGGTLDMPAGDDYSDEQRINVKDLIDGTIDKYKKYIPGEGWNTMIGTDINPQDPPIVIAPIIQPGQPSPGTGLEA